MAEEPDQELSREAADPDAEITKIKSEIVDTRSQMGETIDEIQDRLSVSAITANIKEEVSEQLASAVESTKNVLYTTTVERVGKIMKNLSGFANASGGALPLLLIGAGTGLILMNRGNGGRTKNRNRNGSGRTQNTEDRSSARGVESSSTARGMTEAAAGAYHRVEEAVSTTASRVADVAATGKEKYVNYFDKNPMAVGAIAAAMGLAVGLALPLTEAESELLGETAGSLRDRLEGAAKETVGTLKETATDFLEGIESSAEGRPATGSQVH